MNSKIEKILKKIESDLEGRNYRSIIDVPRELYIRISDLVLPEDHKKLAKIIKTEFNKL
jgi:hypothetical protein